MSTDYVLALSRNPENLDTSDDFLCAEAEAASRLHDEAYDRGVVRVRTDKGNGSGFFLHSEGSVISAAHVVLHAKEIFVITSEGKKYRARITDLSDTADLVKLKLEGFNNPDQKVLQFAPNSNFTKEQNLMTIGHPRGRTNVESSSGEFVGKVTVYDLVHKDKVASKFKLLDATEKRDWLTALSGKMIEAKIGLEPGNSGGPLINGDGHVVGIANIANQRVPQSYFRSVEDLNGFLSRQDKPFEFTYTHLPTAPEQRFKTPSSSLATYSTVMLLRDYQSYKTSTYGPDILKHGIATLFDVAIVAGTHARRIPGLESVGNLALGAGLAGRIGADQIPHRLVLSEIRRADGSTRAPFDWSKIDLKSGR